MRPPLAARLPGASAWADRHERWLVAASLLPLLWLFGHLYLPMLPNAQGALATDYGVFVADLLAGYFWFQRNGLFALPWFSPHVCGGVPFLADPQVPYVTLTQALTLVVSPMAAVRATILAAAGAGYLGTYALARAALRASAPASLLAGVLFMFNAFFVTRMLIGHLNMVAFMLLPALLLAVLPWPAAPARAGLARDMLRVGCAGLLVATMILSGMLQLALPAALTAAAILLLAGLTVGWSWRAVARLAAGGVLGVALAAFKLLPMLALLRQFPRDHYALLGLEGWRNSLLLPVQMLLLGPPDAPDEVIHYNPFPTTLQFMLERHEFEYSVTPLPAVLLLAALAALPWTHRAAGRIGWQALLLCAAALLAVVALPLAVNAYSPHWAALLKTVPVVRNSSNLLRWFASYILPVILAAALALDRLTRGRGPRVAWGAGGVLVAVALSWVAQTDLTYYENRGYGADTFPEAPVEAGWRAVRAGGPVPPIAGMSLDGSFAAGAALTDGLSQVHCHWPVFGYMLEDLPPGTLHAGDPLDPFGGRLNLRNPACDLFPGENACRPGDQFKPDETAAARLFLQYRPYPFTAPWWLAPAEWLSAATALALALALPLCAWRVRRARRPAVG